MANASISTTQQQAAPTRARWGILALIAISTMINYLDRTVLGIAAPSLRTDLGNRRGDDGHRVFRLLLDVRGGANSRRRVPRSLRIEDSLISSRLTFWSLFTLLQALATGLYSLVFYRFGLGLAKRRASRPTAAS